MTYLDLMYYHLATVVPCFVIGTLLLLIRKGTPVHRRLGRIYMVLMLVTATITLFMPAEVGPRVLNHFGWIHSFSFLTLYTVPTAYWVWLQNGEIQLEARCAGAFFCGQSCFVIAHD